MVVTSMLRVEENNLKTKNFQNRKYKRGGKTALVGCSVTTLREPGMRRRGVSQNRRLYLQIGYKGNVGTHGMTFNS